MKPWTERKQIASAMRNEHIRIGQRGPLRGIYATKDFAAGDYVASFHGVIITRDQLFTFRESEPALFEKINEYAVWHTQAQGHLYPTDIDKPGAHLIDHSCGPNAKFGRYERGAQLVQAVKPIKADDEITVHYGWLGIKAAYENNRHPCACQAPLCVGTIELRVELLDYGDGTGGPDLSREEIAKRLLADICNDSDDNEALLHRYATSALDMMRGVKIAAKLDPIAFHEKLREGAHAAVLTAMHLRETGRTISATRLRQIVRAYNVPPALATADEHHPLERSRQ